MLPECEFSGGGGGIEPPVMLCGYCNVLALALGVDPAWIEPPVMLCGYCNGAAAGLVAAPGARLSRQ